MTKPTDTLTKADIAAYLMAQSGLSNQQSHDVVNAFFNEVCDSLAAGHDVKLSGFGRFCIKSKSARPGRNPKTGQAYTISARQIVTFKPSHLLRAPLNND